MGKNSHVVSLKFDAVTLIIPAATYPNGLTTLIYENVAAVFNPGGPPRKWVSWHILQGTLPAALDLKQVRNTPSGSDEAVLYLELFNGVAPIVVASPIEVTVVLIDALPEAEYHPTTASIPV